MFDRFSEDSVKAMVLAQEEGRRLGHPAVGTEHILLGLMQVKPEWVAAFIGEGALDKARDAVMESKGHGSGSGDEMPFTDNARKLLEESWQHAKRMGQKKIRAGHLMLAAIHSHATATDVLAKLNAQLVMIEMAIMGELDVRAGADVVNVAGLKFLLPVQSSKEILRKNIETMDRVIEAAPYMSEHAAVMKKKFEEKLAELEKEDQ